MIKEDQQKQIDELVEKMKSEVTDEYTIIHVLQDYAEHALTSTWLETENIILAAYQLGKESNGSKMIHNAWAEMGANAKLFYDAFRGLCRMRIAYAQNQINFLELETEPDQMFPLLLADAEKIEKFWSKVKEYWEGKLQLSYQWEKDYFGSNKVEVTEYGKSLGSEV